MNETPPVSPTHVLLEEVRQINKRLKRLVLIIEIAVVLAILGACASVVGLV